MYKYAQLCLVSKTLRRDTMARNKLFLILLILFILITSTGCLKTNGSGGAVPEYSLSIAVNPEGSGQVITEPSGPRYKKGTTVSLTAAPNTGWAFHQWTGGITGTTNPTTIVVNANKTVTANFVRMKHTLTINVTGEGTVTQEIVAIEAAMHTEYDYGTKVKLTAQPSPGWLFSHWEGDLTGDTNPDVIELDSDKNVTAVFEPEVGTVTGIITKGRSGPPVAGATVTVLRNGTEMDSATTDAGGKYTLSVPAGDSVDLVASKNGLAGARFQGITVAEGETVVADLIMQDWKISGESTLPPSLIINGISPGGILSGTVDVDVELEGDFPARAVYVEIGAEFPFYSKENPPYWFNINTNRYPDGESFLYIIAYDENNNCVITRIPVIIDNQEDSGPALTMTKPVLVIAVTMGDDYHIDALGGLEKSIGFGDKGSISRLQEHLSILAVEERSVCFVELRWEPEFSTESGFIGYNVYRSNGPDGPWQWLGTAFEAWDEAYEMYDTTPQVAPGVPSYYKVVPFSANGVEGTGMTAGPVIPLGRFEVNLVSPEHNASGVELNPTLIWSHNGLAAQTYEYDVYLENPLMGWEAWIYLTTADSSETSVQYDTNWNSYFELENNGQYRWDVELNRAVIEYDEYTKAISYGYKGRYGSYNGPFVFTTKPADE
jgi:hypothetical protein